MLFPKKRMRLVNTYQGKSDPDGWVVLDLKGFDLEGASTLYLSMADVQKLQAGGDVQAAKLARARALLGGLSDDDDEGEE